MKTWKLFNVAAIIAILGISAVFLSCVSYVWSDGVQFYGKLKGTKINIAREVEVTDQQVEEAIATIHHLFGNLNRTRQNAFKKNITNITVGLAGTGIGWNKWNRGGGWLGIPYNINENALSMFLENHGFLE
jgi:hypothetical protein